jgi:hypothetical protein
MFGGGQIPHRDTVDVFNLNSSNWIKTNLSLNFGRGWLSAGAVGNCAVFAGGEPPSNGTGSVDMFCLEHQKEIGPTHGPTWKVPNAPNIKKEHCGFHLLPNDNKTMKAVEVYHASKEIGAYNHAVMMDFHDGNFLLTWKNSPLDEDSPGQRILYSQSIDGQNWTTTDGNNILFPNMTSPTTPVALFGAPTVILNGRRYASASPQQFCLFPAPVTSPVLLRQVISGPTIPSELGRLFWLSNSIPKGYEEASKREGVVALSDMDDQTRADMVLLLNVSHLPCDEEESLKCEACLNGCDYKWKMTNDKKLSRDLGGGAEYTRYSLPNQTGEVILHRTRNHELSYTYRETVNTPWTQLSVGHIPDSDSNLNAGTLPDGKIFLTSNPCTKGRDPLVVSTSVDGWYFDRAVGVMSCRTLDNQCAPRIKGKSKDPGQAYPQAVAVTEPSHLSFLWIAASNNKEDIWVARVAYDAL